MGALDEGREIVLKIFKSEMFPLKPNQKQIKIQIPKEMLQRLQITLAQVNQAIHQQIY